MLEAMLEGIEYLMVNNPMGKALKFIYASGTRRRPGM